MDNLEQETNVTPEMDNLQEQIETEVTEAEEKEEQQEVTETDEERKERRRQEQERGSRMEVEKYRNLAIDNAVEAAKRDVNSIIELAKKDKALADDVAKRFNYDDYEDLKKQHNIDQEPDPEEEFERKYQERKTKENHEEAMSKVMDKINGLGDLKDSVLKEFEELSEGKRLNYDKAMKLYDIAMTYVKKDNIKSEKLDNAKAEYAGTGLSKSEKSDKSVKQYRIGKGGKLEEV